MSGRSFEGSRCVGLDDIDLTDLASSPDGFPHDAFTRLRGEAPVWWHEPTSHTPDGTGFWVVSRHARHAGDRGRRRGLLLGGRARRTGRGHADRGPALRVRRRGPAQHDGRPPAPSDPPSGHPGAGTAGPGAPRRRAPGPHRRHPRRRGETRWVRLPGRGGGRAPVAGHRHVDGHPRRGPARPDGLDQRHAHL